MPIYLIHRDIFEESLTRPLISASDGGKSFRELIFTVLNIETPNRICPGRHLADQSVWITITSILASFTISPALSGSGEPIIPSEEFEFGVTRYFFNCGR